MFFRNVVIKRKNVINLIKSQAPDELKGFNLSILSGADLDNDGLPDAFEDAIGADKNKADTDGDGFSDKAELVGGFSPLAKDQKINYNQSLAVKQKGKILLQQDLRT